MSEPAPAPRPASDPADPLHADIERIDKSILDLVAQRLRLADGLKMLAPNDFPMKPGAEAAMLRRLIAMAPEPVDPDLVVELWRALIAANIRRASPLDVAVAGGTDPILLFDIARRHFGARTRIRRSNEPQMALLKAIELQNTVAVVPWPAAPGVGSWWPALSESRFHKLYLVAGLPIRAGEEDPQACVFAKTLPEPAGDDITMMIVFDPHHRAQRALNELGFKGREVARSEPRALLRVEGFIAHDDPRAAAMTRYGLDAVRVLGSFARV